MTVTGGGNDTNEGREMIGKCPPPAPAIFLRKIVSASRDDFVKAFAKNRLQERLPDY